jgi:hypothetical protein
MTQPYKYNVQNVHVESLEKKMIQFYKFGYLDVILGVSRPE